LFAFGISEKDISVEFVELDAVEQAIEVNGAYAERSGATGVTNSRHQV
jgi:hypothetical protein